MVRLCTYAFLKSGSQYPAICLRDSSKKFVNSWATALSTLTVCRVYYGVKPICDSASYHEYNLLGFCFLDVTGLKFLRLAESNNYAQKQGSRDHGGQEVRIRSDLD